MIKKLLLLFVFLNSFIQYLKNNKFYFLLWKKFAGSGVRTQATSVTGSNADH